MNLILLDHTMKAEHGQLCIVDQRQVHHVQQVLQAKVGDRLKVGIRNLQRYDTEICEITTDRVLVNILESQPIPAKLPVTLIVALPRPKVLRRLVMDSVSLGVSKLVLLHSYRVDKSYWQTPFLQQLHDYVQLGLEQAGDVIAPEICLEKRFKPFVEDRLSQWSKIHPTFVAHPYTDQSLPVAFDQACQLVIGPEGGFIPYEIELFQKNGCHIMGLGSRILRTETAISTTLGRLFSRF